MNKRRGKKYSKKIKKEVVSAIVNGELLIGEAVKKYNICTKATIVRWLKVHVAESDTIP
ncbi:MULTISPECIES: hypothetical protein [Sphingobacterium]|uniref:hypothetical protein n=1 Tax=Sphingobacterium TaxID=28453 RepID=UPI0013D913C4|nr:MULTISPECIES: hypothetical protein [unclassified Sphingobacterium]